MNHNEQLTISMTQVERAALLELLRRVTLQGDEALTYVQVKARIDAAEPVKAAPCATGQPDLKDASHGQ